MKSKGLMLAAVIVLWSTLTSANECVAPKIPKISGALCGRLIDSSGAAEPDVALCVLGDSDRIIAETKADSNGDLYFLDSRKANIA